MSINVRKRYTVALQDFEVEFHWDEVSETIVMKIDDMEGAVLWGEEANDVYAALGMAIRDRDEDS